jgi:hypothetical protein
MSSPKGTGYQGLMIPEKEEEYERQISGEEKKLKEGSIMG